MISTPNKYYHSRPVEVPIYDEVGKLSGVFFMRIAYEKGSKKILFRSIETHFTEPYKVEYIEEAEFLDKNINQTTTITKKGEN